MPHGYFFGQIAGITEDSHGNIWVISRPRSIVPQLDEPPQEASGVPAPAVVEFDAKGNFIRGWGGTYQMSEAERSHFDWPVQEHGIAVDNKDNVWICGNGKDRKTGKDDNQCLKFTTDGKFIMQIGHASQSKGSLDTENLNHAAWPVYYAPANELFVADGYVNRRVIVFDADTGKFKRMWGAYGHQPPKSVLSTKKQGRGENATEVNVMTTPEPVRKFDGEGAKEWSTVHGVVITPDGVVWIADRIGNRIQQFKIDGTYIKEAFVDRKTSTSQGTVYTFSFSPDGKWVYVADGGNKAIHILDRSSLKEMGTLGNHCGGQMPGCFNHVHVTGVDSAGNVYTGEANFGARIQRWNIVK